MEPVVLSASHSPNISKHHHAVLSRCLIDSFDLFFPCSAHFFSILQLTAFAAMILKIVVVLRASCRVAADEKRLGISE